MRERETTLQQFREFILKARLVKPSAAPYVVRFVRQFLARPAVPGFLADRVRGFCEDLERTGRPEWQVQQADHALRIYFVTFLHRTDWNQVPGGADQVQTIGSDPLAAVEQLRGRIRTKHYSGRPACSPPSGGGPASGGPPGGNRWCLAA
jgi:hypothetical protein